MKNNDSSLNYVFSRDGTPFLLGKKLGAGGEGDVYRLPYMPGKVAKIYKPDKRQDREPKLALLIQRHISPNIENSLVLSFPEELLYSEQGEFIGFTMPQFSSRLHIYEVYRARTRDLYFPKMSWRDLVGIAYNLSEALCFLHANGVVLGDMNPNNIVVNSDGSVSLLDLDSCCITDPVTKQHFYCRVGFTEMLAPELLASATLSPENYSQHSDAFSLAILIFQLLMDGFHPFNCVTHPSSDISSSLLTPQNEIAHGKCAYFRDIPDRVRPNGAITLEILPSFLKHLFARVFDYDSTTMRARISLRPSAFEWREALLKLYHEPMEVCQTDARHTFIKTLAHCPWCEQQAIQRQSVTAAK